MEEERRLIRNYGLFWQKSQVDWSARRHGKLVGLGQKHKKKGQVDFASQRGIYALYDDTFRLVYAGQAGRGNRRLFARLRIHAHSVLSERWTRFSWFGICPVNWETGGGVGNLVEVEDEIVTDKPNVLNHLEAILIMAAEPVTNRQGGRFGKEVVHFRQVRLDKIGATPSEDDFPEDEDI